MIDLATLSGTWSDGATGDGAFVFNGPGGGPPRPSGISALIGFGTPPTIISRRADGTPAAPLPVPSLQALLVIGARGHDGTGFPGSNSSQILVSTSESWTPNARGSRISFSTTANGTASLQRRMLIEHDGKVGIGVSTPQAQLDVLGNIRIGIGFTGCVQARDGTVLVGVCPSDARFKQDIVSFEPTLDKIASLRPVHFHWRSNAFPTRGFGTRESYGLIAQEVEQVLPELVVVDDEGYKAVNYSKLPLLALQAIKELKAANDALQARNARLEQRNAEFEQRLSELEDRLRSSPRR